MRASEMTTENEKLIRQVERVQFDCDPSLYDKVVEYRFAARHKTFRAAMQALLRAGLASRQAVRTATDTQGNG